MAIVDIVACLGNHSQGTLQCLDALLVVYVVCRLSCLCVIFCFYYVYEPVNDGAIARWHDIAFLC